MDSQSWLLQAFGINELNVPQWYSTNGSKFISENTVCVFNIRGKNSLIYIDVILFIQIWYIWYIYIYVVFRIKEIAALFFGMYGKPCEMLHLWFCSWSPYMTIKRFPKDSDSWVYCFKEIFCNLLLFLKQLTRVLALNQSSCNHG